MSFLYSPSSWCRPRRFTILMAPPPLLLLLLLLLLLWNGEMTTHWYAEASLISESSLQQCTNDGESPLKCGHKLVVSLSIPAGLKAGAESINFLSTATNSSSNSSVSFDPISMTVRRSEMYYRYPLSYVANFNANPYEELIKKSVADPCDDSPSSKATCGLAYTPAGEVIPYSQGFCCSCGLCAGMGFCDANARASQACHLLSDYGSASCLRFGEEWYTGTTIGSARTWFSLDLEFRRNTTDAKVMSSTITLSPSVLQMADENFGVVAELIGTFSPSVEPVNLEQSMMFTPIPVGMSPQPPPSANLILPLTMVTLDGSECNKVGVSYSGFASQGSRCDMEVGSCLKNQLSKLAADDADRMASGAAPLYMASRYGEILVATFKEVEQSGVDLYLMLPSVAPPNTLITVSIDADSLEFIISVSDGNITQAAMKNSTVTSMTDGAVMLVDVTNTGKITASYTLDVVNCTGGVIPIPGQHVSLDPGSTRNFEFDVYCQERMNGTAHCEVVLYNALAEKVDQKTVEWYLQDYQETKGAQGDTVGEDSAQAVVTQGTGSCSSCSFVNVICTLKYKCWSMFGGLLALIGGLGGGLVLLFLFRSQVFSLVKKVLSCCCGGSSSSSSSTSSSPGSSQRDHNKAKQRQRRRQRRAAKREPTLCSSFSSSLSSSSRTIHDVAKRGANDENDENDDGVCPYGGQSKRKVSQQHSDALRAWQSSGRDHRAMLPSLMASGVSQRDIVDGGEPQPALMASNGGNVYRQLFTPVSTGGQLYTSQRRECELAAALSLREPMDASGAAQPNLSYRRVV